MEESLLLSRAQCREIFDIAHKSARRAGVNDIEVILTSPSDSLTRFANNQIHQNVSERSSGVSIRTLVDGRTARASTNLLDLRSIENVVDEAIALTRAADPLPGLPRLY